MDEFVARLNIDHLREAFAAEKDEGKRKVLARLLAKEETTLAQAIEKKKMST